MTSSLRICFIGDSITLGTGDPECRAWPNRLCGFENARNRHDLTCYNLGIRADTSRDIAARWKSEVHLRLPSHVAGGLVFSFGVNDCAEQRHRGIRVEHRKSVETARRILQSAKEWLPVLWIGPTPVRDDEPEISPSGGVHYRFNNDRLAALNHDYRLAADDLRIPYLDLHDRLSGDPAWTAVLAAGDGVHPDGSGQEQIMESVRDWTAWRRWIM